MVQPFVLYTANFDGTSSTISGFSVDSDTGALTALAVTPFAVSVSNYIGTDLTGTYLYVTTGASVVGYSIDRDWFAYDWFAYSAPWFPRRFRRRMRTP